MSSRRKMIVGNWKMYKTIEEGESFLSLLLPKLSNPTVDVWLAVPFTMIKNLSDEAKDSPVWIGAQNMNDATEGAFTGEIAGRMLKDAGAKFVILGHSERRLYFKESDEFIHRKVKRALKEKLIPLLCVGESLEARKEGKEHDVVSKQLKAALSDIPKEEASTLVIAYEPSWAIGTGNPATPEDLEKMHQIIRQILKEIWDEEIANTIKILYGGSVTEKNAQGFILQEDIDGLLVGGASLSPESFAEIINAAQPALESSEGTT